MTRIKHIVMWKLKDSAEGAGRIENAKKIKAMIDSLKDTIPEVRYLEVGINLNDTDAAFDLALYSEFESKEDLNAYLKAPAHLKVADFVALVREKRAVVDYEL